MLVLSRKRGEQVVFPDQKIVVTVLEVHGDRVRLGIVAPSAIGIYREEIWARIKASEEPANTPVASEAH
jgi:carbon storage regulator